MARIRAVASHLPLESRRHGARAATARWLRLIFPVAVSCLTTVGGCGTDPATASPVVDASAVDAALPDAAEMDAAAMDAAGNQDGGGDHKAPCKGLMLRDLDRDGPIPPTMPFIDSAVVSLDWSTLESSDQAFDGPGWTSIENARKLGLRIRLRIRAGVGAPDFVKRLGGPPLGSAGLDCAAGGIAITQADVSSGCTTYFWTPEVLDQYEQLMTEVARRYESAPEVREVVDSACMTIFAEPFYRAHGQADANARLSAAGLNRTVDLACHQRGLMIHEKLFKRTATSLAINPWDVITTDAATKNYVIEWNGVRDLVDQWRLRMGPRLVLQNNGLGEADGCDPASTKAPHFCYLKAAAPPKGFQTETYAKLGATPDGVVSAVQRGMDLGATFIELPNGFDSVPVATLSMLDAMLEATP